MYPPSCHTVLFWRPTGHRSRGKLFLRFIISSVRNEQCGYYLNLSNTSFQPPDLILLLLLGGKSDLLSEMCSVKTLLRVTRWPFDLLFSKPNRDHGSSMESNEAISGYWVLLSCSNELCLRSELAASRKDTCKQKLPWAAFLWQLEQP